MLGYIRRIGKEFRDPYTFKTLYDSFVQSRVEPVLRRTFEKNRGYPEEDFEIHVAYAEMELRCRTTSVLSKVPFD
jgi:predicted secreted Zn-dependent protease